MPFGEFQSAMEASASNAPEELLSTAEQQGLNPNSQHQHCHRSFQSWHGQLPRLFQQLFLKHLQRKLRQIKSVEKTLESERTDVFAIRDEGHGNTTSTENYGYQLLLTSALQEDILKGRGRRLWLEPSLTCEI